MFYGGMAFYRKHNHQIPKDRQWHRSYTRKHQISGFDSGELFRWGTLWQRTYLRWNSYISEYSTHSISLFCQVKRNQIASPLRISKFSVLESILCIDLIPMIIADPIHSCQRNTSVLLWATLIALNGPRTHWFLASGIWSVTIIPSIRRVCSMT